MKGLIKLRHKSKVITSVTAIIISIFTCYNARQINKYENVVASKAKVYEPSRSGYIDMKCFSIPTKGTVTSKFGVRWGKMHNGIDIGAPFGTPIYSAASGVVSFAGWQQGYGNVIKIDHGGGIETVYGHCEIIYVKNGEKVPSGQKIGAVGSTGNSTGPHVHFEIRVNGTPQNPLNYTKQI